MKALCVIMKNSQKKMAFLKSEAGNRLTIALKDLFYQSFLRQHSCMDYHYS